MGGSEKINNTKLSVVIITKNEGENLSRLLPTLKFANEVIILDSESTDNTKEVALKHGVRFYVEPWKGFGPQKNRACELATHNWVLCLDADEMVTPELEVEILNLLSQIKTESPQCYRIPRISFFLNRWIRHGGWYPDYQIRLFNKNFFQWNLDLIHEKVVPLSKDKENISIGTLKSNLKHFVFRSVHDQIETNNRYSGLLAEKDFKMKKKTGLLTLVVKPWVKFFECYFLKLGVLDGIPGFIIAINAAHSIFLRKVKLWEKQS